jgi:hypothetical protein
VDDGLKSVPSPSDASDARFKLKIFKVALKKHLLAKDNI